MILVTDGGSTKCDWALLSDGKLLKKTQTEGLNPNILSFIQLEERIVSNDILTANRGKITQVHFYGAGCGALKSRQLLEEVFRKIFDNAEIAVSEDTAGAVKAVTNEPGIVCILGTGSNSCFYDGKDILHPIGSLGFILMDEASANYFGKRLINDYYYKRMPVEIAKEFREDFEIGTDHILLNLYKKPSPGIFLASFSKFIFKNPEKSLQDEYFRNLLRTGIDEFIQNRILTFSEAKEVPIHFVGTIAHFSSPIIQDLFKEYQLQLGNIIRYPIDGLVRAYLPLSES